MHVQGNSEVKDFIFEMAYYNIKDQFQNKIISCDSLSTLIEYKSIMHHNIFI